MAETTKTFHLKSSHIMKKDVRGELEMTKEQLVRMAAKLGLKQGNPKAEDILKIVLDESYKKKPNT
ncbi:hypothetical protein DN406_20050 [Bacillus sp. BB56-3]|nr:hypothetical protein DN406_20050 [Bacillus sp. BB56-3]